LTPTGEKFWGRTLNGAYKLLMEGIAQREVINKAIYQAQQNSKAELTAEEASTNQCTL